jgi:signal transduction histidine kinase
MGPPAIASSPILPTSWQKGELRTLLVTLGVCCWVGLWNARQHSDALVPELITSNAIGVSSYSLLQIVRLFFHGRLPAWAVPLSIPSGFLVGSKLAGWLGGYDVWALMFRNPIAMRNTIIDTSLIAGAITAFFLYFSYTRGVKLASEQNRRRAAEALQAETASRLALLQAQIEPHFLFNTLANIHSLIAEKPDTASHILEKLNSYLRISLRRSRQLTSTLAEELELVETLLSIAGARLGARLEYNVSVPEELRSHQLPPLLLQPLVENAIRHGIEPAVGGGKIAVEVRKTRGSLELTVTDTGVGLSEESPQGVGLANIRARLSSLYATEGKLALYANSPRGVIAKLFVPTSPS